MDRIARIGHQHDVAGRGDRLRDIGEAFLRTERRDDLRFGIELHAEAARVIGRLRAAQSGHALRGGIAVGARLAERLFQLVDDMLRRGQIGIAHAEIDDIGACVACRCLGAIDLLEHIGRQAANAMKFFHDTKALFRTFLVGSSLARRVELLSRVLFVASLLRCSTLGCGFFGFRGDFPAGRRQIVFELLLLVIGQDRAVSGGRHVMHGRIGWGRRPGASPRAWLTVEAPPVEAGSPRVLRFDEHPASATAQAARMTQRKARIRGGNSPFDHLYHAGALERCRDIRSLPKGGIYPANPVICPKQEPGWEAVNVAR